MFPNEVEMEILSWLPAQNVVQLQLVCKRWRSMLRDQPFRQLWGRRRRHHMSDGGMHFFLLHQEQARGHSHVYRPPSFAEAQHWRFAPPGSRLVLSTGGLLVCATETTYFLGNPVTGQWVHFPRMTWPEMSAEMLMQYKSGGHEFFRFWFAECFIFDSRLGIWTFSMCSCIVQLSCNSVCIGEKYYALGDCFGYDTLVLLEVDDTVQGSWVYAWDFAGFGPQGSTDDAFSELVCMVDVGGQVGFVPRKPMPCSVQPSAFVLDTSCSQGRWKWKRLHPDWHDVAYGASTSTSLAPVTDNATIGILDPWRLTWHRLEHPAWESTNVVTFEPNLAAEVPSVAVPSRELQEACLTREPHLRRRFGRALPPLPTGTFKDLQSRRDAGMSWREIGQQLQADASQAMSPWLAENGY